jgi:regulator of sigma E protease
MIGGMFSGAVSPKHLSGPVTIFYLAGQEAEAGWERFMFLMVMISMSIALVNLLPVPGLDGGHILIATIEMIIRRRLPIKVRLALQSVGVLFILSLILFALGNDALRMWRLSQGG